MCCECLDGGRQKNFPTLAETRARTGGAQRPGREWTMESHILITLPLYIICKPAASADQAMFSAEKMQCAVDYLCSQHSVQLFVTEQGQCLTGKLFSYW